MATTRKPRRKVGNRKNHEQETSGPMGDAFAILLLLFALLYFFALASYTSADLPTWMPLHPYSQPNDPTQNFIGPVGAVVAGLSYFSLGIAAYLVPVGLIWFAFAKLVSRVVLGWIAFAGWLLAIFTGSCICQVQGIALDSWYDGYMSLGPGGGVGHVLGERVFEALIGKVGSFIFLCGLYIVGMIMMTGFPPALVFAAVHRGFGGGFDRLRTWTAGLFSRSDRVAKPKAKPTRKKPKRRPVAAEVVAEDEDEDEELVEAEEIVASAPEPVIIDASARSESSDASKEKKPTLEELREKQAKKRESTNRPFEDLNLSEAYSDFQLPPLDILDYDDSSVGPADKGALLAIQQNIVKTLDTFGIKVTPGNITRGPTITRYEVYPTEGLRVKRIADAEADLARATRAESINILAPIPGKDTVGIEIANDERVTVTLRELIDHDEFQKTKAKIPIALGKDVYGKTIIGDLAAMPHLIIAGATGAGKSVCINCIIASLLYKFRPDELRFIMVDPKVVELQPYRNLPHLAIPLVTDPKKVLLALRWVVKEMEKRYQMFKQEGCKDFTSFNGRHARRDKKAAKDKAAGLAKQAAAHTSSRGTVPELAEDAVASHPINMDGAPLHAPDAGGSPEEFINTPPGGPKSTMEEMMEHAAMVGDIDCAPPLPGLDEDVLEIPEKLPYIVVIIDELADLMDTAPADVELAIVRIAQMARASGIHLILATQTPRAEVITGRIRANVPTKIAFRVSSAIESRVILENKGAERLVGKGDMLFMPPGTSTVLRAQGALITEEEIDDLVAYVGEQGDPIYEADITETIENADSGGDDALSDEEEETIERCIEILRQEDRASTSMLQRRLRLGYNRASRMMDILQERGIVGPGDGAKPREILVDLRGGGG